MAYLTYISDDGEKLIFDRRCPLCGMFVKNDETVSINGFGQPDPNELNATCKTHGRVAMSFLGYYDYDD